MEIIEQNLTQLSTRDFVSRQLIVTCEGFKLFTRKEPSRNADFEIEITCCSWSNAGSADDLAVSKKKRMLEEILDNFHLFSLFVSFRYLTDTLI